MDPAGFAETNVLGTRNVSEACAAHGTKLVFASTCKAADPETAYGASKLIAERIVLNMGGVVFRLFNIPECGPSVFTIWQQIPEDEPIPFTDCWRYFITLEQAVDGLIRASALGSGRYAADPGSPLHMRAVAEARYPGREPVEIPRRRGDRAREPLHAKCEHAVRIYGSGAGDDGLLCQITSPHDPGSVPAREAVAA